MSDINEKRTLPKTTPLIFQWLPKSFGKSIPNNQDYPYLQRLVSWAERESQRDIYLVINGAGLSAEQVKDLKEELNPMPNIKVVDFNAIDLNESHFTLSTTKKEFKISEFYQKLYNDEQINRMPFGLEIDLMRTLILYNINKVTGEDKAIYFDFDILPDSNGKKIDDVEKYNGILMADGLENSIIAINTRGKEILFDALQAVFDKLQKKTFNEKDNNMMWDAIKKEIRKRSGEYDYECQKFLFEGNVQQDSDTSWMRTEKLYKKPKLPIHFNKASTNMGQVNIINITKQIVKFCK